MDYKELKISTQEVIEILSDLYKIQGTISELPGDVDFNFRVKTKDNDGYILKISRPDQDENYLNFQQSILQHLKAHNISLLQKL